jgi:hypothetical protein
MKILFIFFAFLLSYTAHAQNVPVPMKLFSDSSGYILQGATKFFWRSNDGTLIAVIKRDSIVLYKPIKFPGLTTTQKLAISSPTEGLEVYDLTLHQKSYYNGTSWVNY